MCAVHVKPLILVCLHSTLIFHLEGQAYGSIFMLVDDVVYRSKCDGTDQNQMLVATCHLPQQF